MACHDRPCVLLAIRIDAIGPGRLPAMFHRAGCRIHLFSPPHLAVRRSRFVDRLSPAPAEPESFAQHLCEHLARNGADYSWVQLGDEATLRAAAGRCRADCGAGCLPVPRTPRHIALITDKLVFLRAAAEAGLPIPKFVLCPDPDALATATRHIGFPLLIKRAEGMAGAGIRFFANERDIVLDDWVCTPNRPLMVQTFVRGITGSCEVLFDHGRPVAWLSSVHREFWPTPWTASCVRELIELPEAEDLLARVGKLTGFHGLAGIDWLRSNADQRRYLIELNPRATPCYHLGRRVGVDFAAGLRDLIAGVPACTQRPATPAADQAMVHQFPQYCFRAIDDHTFSRLPRVLGDVPWNDPLLVAAHIRRIVTHYLPWGLRQSLKNRFR